MNARPLLPVVACVVSLSPRVGAEPGVPQEERPRVSYEAPTSCPDVQVAQSLTGEAFVMRPGGAKQCPSCTRSIVIEEHPSDPARFHVVVSAAVGHREELARPVCSEALAFAAHVLRATHVANETSATASKDHDRPESTEHRPAVEPDASGQRPLRLGVFGSRLLAPYSGESVTLLGAGFGMVLDSWRVSPHGAWLVPRQVEDTGRQTVPLQQSGYAAGLDLCRRAYEHLHACGLGSVRWMTVDPGENWRLERGSEVLVGGALSWLQPLPARLELEVQLGALFAPVPMRFEDAQRNVAYTNPAVEAQLRVGLAWGFDVAQSTPPLNLDRVAK